MVLCNARLALIVLEDINATKLKNNQKGHIDTLKFGEIPDFAYLYDERERRAGGPFVKKDGRSNHRGQKFSTHKTGAA